MNKLIVVGLSSLFLLSACATKQYPQASRVTAEEISSFRCDDVKVEIAKARSIQKEIERTGGFDGKTVLGFLGDFGVGNGMAKSDAREKSKDRLYELEQLKLKTCSD